MINLNKKIIPVGIALSLLTVCMSNTSFASSTQTIVVMDTQVGTYDYIPPNTTSGEKGCQYTNLPGESYRCMTFGVFIAGPGFQAQPNGNTLHVHNKLNTINVWIGCISHFQDNPVTWQLFGSSNSNKFICDNPN